MFSRLTNSKRAAVITAVVVSLVAEFILLVGTSGIGLPRDRHSAVSTVAIRDATDGIHYVTRNQRFSVVEVPAAKGPGDETLILRETFYVDRNTAVEGIAKSEVTVEGLSGNSVRWKIHAEGEIGDALTDRVYRVRKGGCCGSANEYSYFSLVNGRMLRNTTWELPVAELTALDGLAVR